MKIVTDKPLRIATLHGAIVLFYPGVVKEIADEIGLLAMQQGAKQVETSKPDLKLVVEEEVKVEEQVNGATNDERFDRLVAILEGLIDKGDPADFKLDGAPKAKAVSEAFGGSVIAEERQLAWDIALNL